MKPPRVRLRTLLIAVVIVAVVLGILSERRIRFARIADYHDRLCDPAYVSSGRFTARQSNWHGGMGVKYRIASNNPWLPMPSDPLMPK